ncbi:DEKNAAC100215 [Brettanomyces naardenensis]|uniref:DEKNAAC100215 n=1 Tax=Brettanomyces naardenensis TaxID=13370 RepID=A0A448YG92_BRENA|nr:DEKNAAC100215 [Brettanomyces naardenensis]
MGFADWFKVMGLADWYQFLGHSRPFAPTFVDKDYPDLTGKVYLVTGGGTGIGYEVTKKLLGKNAKVWILGRNPAKLQKSVDTFKEEFPGAKLETIVADLADLATIKPAAVEFLKKETKLNGIIHNAGVMTPPSGSKTKQGYELQLGTNNVGPFLLQTFLDDLIIAIAKAEPPNTVRILWVSSSAHLMSCGNGGIQWEDLNYEKAAPGLTTQATAYGQSKAIDIYLSILWAKKHPNSGVVSVTCHPGNLKTELMRTTDVGRIGEIALAILSPLHPAYLGAFTELFAVLSPTLTTADDGAYIIPWGKVGRIRQDVKDGAEGENGEKLWTWLEKQIAPYL